MREEFAHILEEVLKGRGAQYERELDGRRIVRRFEPKERLILLGGGHIARPLCRLGSMLDFEVTVVDDRPSFANSSRFPDAAKVLCSSFEKAIRDLALKSGDYVCVITRGHRYDGECLRAILAGTEVLYLGMIGSKRRVAGLLHQLEEEGFDPERLSRIHSPIGLKIGAKTPAEIAVSICAEIIECRHLRQVEEDPSVLQRTDTDLPLLRFLAEDPSPGALMTVVSTSGSTPVGTGAMMAIDNAGRIFGTIGGGCGEAEAMRKARQIIGSGSSCICEVDMTADPASEEGMVCGGKMRVLVEDK